MDRDAVIVTLRNAEAELRTRGVAHAALFGSMARGEQGPGSDIDIMLDIDPAAGLGVYEYVGVVNFIGDMFSTKVDVSNRKAMRDYVRPNAERDALYAF